MATATITSETLREQAVGFERIDRDAGIIRGVRILGLSSKNGRRYLREAIEKAIPLYEGARVYLDHKELGDRSVRERWGKLENVRLDADGGLVGDLRYLKEHNDTPGILEAAETFEDIGLSHDSLGRSRMEGGERVIYEIVKVNSVDLVEKPATTESLWENVMSKKKVKKNLLAVLRESRAKSPVAASLLRRLTEMGAADPAMADEMGIDDMEVEVEEEAADPAAAGDDAVKAALRAAILAVLDGPDDSALTMKKIKMLMDTGDKVMTAADVTAAADEIIPPELTECMKTAEATIKAKVKEIDALVESLKTKTADVAKSEAKIACRALLESKSREVTDERLRLLESVPEGDRDALVESWALARVKPGASPPLHRASGSGAVTSYQEARKNVRALKAKA